jgi:hypothetical protein
MPQPESGTLGWLISTLKTYEELKAREATYTQAALAHSAEAQSRLQNYRDLMAISGAIADAPGIGRIRLLCDELDNSDGLTAANVVKLRAKLCRAKPCTLEAANLLLLEEAAGALDAKAGDYADAKPAAPPATGSPLAVKDAEGAMMGAARPTRRASASTNAWPRNCSTIPTAYTGPRIIGPNSSNAASRQSTQQRRGKKS